MSVHKIINELHTLQHYSQEVTESLTQNGLEELQKKVEQIRNNIRATIDDLDSETIDTVVIHMHYIAKDTKKLAVTAKLTQKVVSRYSPPPPQPLRTFDYEGKRYTIQSTCGDGACALHALLGQKVNGSYRCDNPRQRFTQELRKKIKEDSKIRTTFKEVMVDHLFQSGKGTDRSSSMLFRGNSTGEKLKGQWQDLNDTYNPHIEYSQSVEAALWLSALENDTYGFLSTQMEAAAAHNIDAYEEESPYYGKSKEEIIEALRKTPHLILNLVNSSDIANFLNYIPIDKREPISNRRKVTDTLIAQLNGATKTLVCSNDFVDHYIDICLKHRYLLNTNEIKLGAQLFGKKAQIFSYQEERGIGPAGSSELLTINKDANGEPIVIYQEGIHFSRCT